MITNLCTHPHTYSSIHPMRPIYLFIHLPTHLPIYPSIHPSTHVFPSILLSAHRLTCHPLFLPSSIFSSFHQFIYPCCQPSVFSSICPTHLSMNPCIHLSIHPSTYPFIHLSIHPSMNPYIHLSTHPLTPPFIHPSIHQFILHPSLSYPSSYHPSVHLSFHPSFLSPTLPCVIHFPVFFYQSVNPIAIHLHGKYHALLEAERSKPTENKAAIAEAILICRETAVQRGSMHSFQGEAQGSWVVPKPPVLIQGLPLLC